MSVSPRMHAVACGVVTRGMHLSDAVVTHGDASVRSGQWWKQGPEVCAHKGAVIYSVWHNQKRLSVSELGCQYSPQLCPSGHHCKGKESGTGRVLYYCIAYIYKKIYHLWFYHEGAMWRPGLSQSRGG